MEMLAALCTGFAVMLFVLYVGRRRLSRPEIVRIQRLADEPAPTRQVISWDDLRRRGPSSLPFLRDVLLQSKWALGMQSEIEQAGLRLRVGEYLIARGAIAVVAFVMLAALTGGAAIGLVIAAVAAVVGWLAPRVWLRMLRRRRVEQISKQLPEATQMLSSALRAGFAFQHGIDMVSRQTEPPLADEFTRVMVDLNIGMGVDEAMLSLLARADSEDMNLVVTAVLVQRASGGNLAEIMDTVSETMRERERLVGEVKTMTSQQRFSGTVLTFWPVGLLGLFALMNWDQTSLLFTTGAGQMLLLVGGGLQLLGYLTIRRILDIEI
ncbi:MAG: type II secretion system F family protein [Dehalococcoidia bacterium]